MKEISSSEAKDLNIALLLELQRFCVQNRIQFWLGYGSLLGCIRHKGIIPWDDDIDIIMPREDYNRFLNDYKDNERFMVASYPKTKGYYNTYAQLVDKRTIVEHKEMNDYEDSGFSIDIFPIDGLGNDYNRIIMIQRIIRFGRMIQLSGQYKDRKMVYCKEKNIIKKAIKFCLANSNSISLHLTSFFISLSQRKGIKDSHYAGFLCGNYREREIMKSELFSETVFMDFEGFQMPVVKQYDEYLSNLYGAYMKLPPAEKRMVPHPCRMYWK